MWGMECHTPIMVNKSAIMKLLWAIAFKTDKLWVRWIHTYYIKRKTVDEVKLPAKASWVLRKVFSCRNEVQQLGGWSNLVANGEYSIKRVYAKLRPVGMKVPWGRLLCNNAATPRSIFVLWLTLHQKLSTFDMLRKWHLNVPVMCAVCGVQEESIRHLFFECTLSAQLWSDALHVLKQSRIPQSWDDELALVLAAARKKQQYAKLHVIFFTEIVYCIWCHRNQVVYQKKFTSREKLFGQVLFRVYSRTHIDIRSMLPNLAIVAV